MSWSLMIQPGILSTGSVFPIPRARLTPIMAAWISNRISCSFVNPILRASSPMLITLTGSIGYLTFLQRISRDFDAMPRYISYICGLKSGLLFQDSRAARIGFSSSINIRSSPSTANKLMSCFSALASIDRRDVSLKIILKQNREQS